MKPSEITAHEIDSIGPKLPPETHLFSLPHLTTGADILAKAGLRGERLSRGPAPWPAYRALKQFVGITFRIERAQRLDCLSRCFPEMRLVNTLSGCVACFLIFFDNINQLPKRYVVTRKVTRIIKKCHRSSNKSYKSSPTLHKVGGLAGDGLMLPADASGRRRRSMILKYREGGYLNICMHPFVSGRALRVAMLDRLIARMKTLPPPRPSPAR
jgi:hypothetical protein